MKKNFIKPPLLSIFYKLIRIQKLIQYKPKQYQEDILNLPLYRVSQKNAQLHSEAYNFKFGSSYWDM